jgi:hypothetical protein
VKEVNKILLQVINDFFALVRELPVCFDGVGGYWKKQDASFCEKSWFSA